HDIVALATAQKVAVHELLQRCAVPARQVGTAMWTVGHTSKGDRSRYKRAIGWVATAIHIANDHVGATVRNRALFRAFVLCRSGPCCVQTSPHSTPSRLHS